MHFIFTKFEIFTMCQIFTKCQIVFKCLITLISTYTLAQNIRDTSCNGNQEFDEKSTPLKGPSDQNRLKIEKKKT